MGHPKPGPKRGRSALVPGATGDLLERRMVEHARLYGAEIRPGDVVLFVDDADCRFCDGGCDRPTCEARHRTWHTALEHRLAEARPEAALVTLLASPETEAWFVVRASECLAALGLRGREAHTALAALREAFPAPVACWGTRKPAGGCEPKFRLKFEAALGGRYRPATQGPGLVVSLDLAKLAEGEDVFVRPAWQALLRLVRSAG